MSQNQQSLENLGAQPYQELPNTSGDTQRFSTNADERLQQSIFKDPHPPVPYHPLPTATTSLDHPQLSSYRYQVKQPQHLESDGSTYAGARRGRSYLMSPKYLEYRDQQRRGTEEDGEPVWSDELEYAFKQALEANPPMGRGKSSERGNSCSRNELIAEYIYKLTGKRRTSKQVSSHLRVLESFLKGNPDWERLVQEQLTGHSNSQIQPFAARWGASIDHLPSSHYSKHINAPYPAPLRMMPPSSRELPLPQCSFTPNLPDPHVSAAQCINFEMWVTSPNTLTRIDDAFHVYTHLQRDQRQAPMPLEELTNWRTSFPRLNSLLSDVNQPLNCEIILVEANLKLMDDFPPKGSKLGIFLELDMVNAMSGSALMTQQMENWMCYNYIYEYGRRTTEAWHSLPEPHTTKIRLPFESSWWAKTFTTLTEDKLEIEASRHHHAAGGCNRQYFRNLTVVQEIRASERASLGRLHNQYPMFPSGESKAMAVILWKFRQTRQNEVGATLWRTLIPSWGGTLARSSNAIRPPPLSSLDLAATSSPTPRLYQPHQTHALLQHTDPSQRPWPLYQPSHDHSSAGTFEFTNSNAKSELLSDKTNSASILNPFTSLLQQTTRQGTDVGGSSGPPAMLQIPDQPRPHTNLGTSGLGHESHLICPVDLGRILEGITDDVDVDEARLKCLRENDLRMESANQGTFSQDWHPGGSKDSSKDSSRAGDSVQTQEPTQNGAITDSGYASTRLDKNEYIQSASDIQHNLPTDPGYTSIEQLKTLQRQSSLQVDAARTIYSDTSSATTLQKESYISELADGLFTKVISWEPDAQTIERIFQILPELLRAFALKVGHNAPSQMHRDVMFFIHKNRANIVSRFKDMCWHQEESLSDVGTDNSEGMRLDEKWTFWNKHLEEHQDPIADSPITNEPTIGNEDAGEEQNEDIHMPELFAYKDFIFKAASYEWLLASLRREVILAPAWPNLMETIRKRILTSLPSSHTISRKSSAEAYTVTFVIDWNPLSFLNDQGYKEEPGEAVERAITLTGTAEDAQALPCAQYLCQTWPSTGGHIIQLVKDIVRAGPGSRQICDLPDNAKVTAWLHESKFKVEAFGTADSVAEIGEQFAWLGAALRSSPHEFGVSCCMPFISGLHISSIPQRVSGRLVWPDILCKIDFTFQVREKQFTPSNAQCWHNLFGNPVVAQGYPIPWRSETSTGLEIPLNMMAGLANTKHVNSFNKKLFIKGFSTMLVPTRQSGYMILWHLIYNIDGRRISYIQHTVPHMDNVSIFDLERARHVLGWCSEARYNAGAADANYLIKPSRLPRPPEGCIYYNDVRIFKGQVIIGSAFSIGHKDTAIHIVRNGYIEKLKSIRRRFFVLWDEEDKRGWLVNGTSALLHLLRASLKHDSMDEISTEFLFNPEDMQEAPETRKASSAIKVLVNSHNRKLPIYLEKEGYLCLEDRIEELYNTLEKVMDYEVGIATQRGTNSSRTRKYLEGWDFNDLATGRDIFYPRVAKLETIGKGWVDFTRAIHAVTLFGRQFGEVIHPISTGSCTKWTELPKSMYYLAASIQDLKEIMDMDGDSEANPIVLAHNITWHNPDIFGTCQCEVKGEEKHSDLVQVLLPSDLKTGSLNNHQVPLEPRGAVIFGHNENFGWFWKDTGYPERREPWSPSEASEIEFRDSGIGSDISSSAPNGRRSSGTSSSQRPLGEGRETLTCESYTVGIICALQKELLAVRILFDDRHEDLERAVRDTNHYALGRIARHYVVAACLPSGEYGTNAAADVVSHLTRSFPEVKFCLLVGIGGGVPSRDNDIRLGDVVVSHPTDIHPGVIQYDLGRTREENTFERTGSLQRPPRFLMTAISTLMSDPDLPSTRFQGYIKDITACNPAYKHPGAKHDKLFAQCNGRQVRRARRSVIHPLIHYGLIASGNKVIKDAETRDHLGAKYNILCFEMEAAGIMNAVPSLVIRGICDYADSHKNKLWQEYACATAAAYAKILLSVA